MVFKWESSGKKEAYKKSGKSFDLPLTPSKYNSDFLFPVIHSWSSGIPRWKWWIACVST